jgi:hypothetical protein
MNVQASFICNGTKKATKTQNENKKDFAKLHSTINV